MKANIEDNDTRIKVGVYSTRFRLIQKAVARHFKMKMSDLETTNRHEPLMQARRHLCRMSREKLSTCSYHLIGALICPHDPIDHTTVRHNAVKMEKERVMLTAKGNPAFPKTVEEIDKINKIYDSLLICRHRRDCHYRAMRRKAMQFKRLIKVA